MAGAVKIEGGMEFPAEAYAYVPDPESPSTWKLRLWETPEKKVTVAQLGRAAAALSPGGFRGRRVQLPAAAIEQVKRRIRKEYGRLGVEDEDIPESVRFGGEGEIVLFEFEDCPDLMPVEKDAKIFEAGDYPDKGITIGEQDLDMIVDNFAEVPVKVEHMDSPLDPLGLVKRIWRRGKELFARLSFPQDLAAFLERRGVKKLSVALYQHPLRLAEVSLVLSPRVPSAAMFGNKPACLRRADGEEVSEQMNHTEESEASPAGHEQFRAEAERDKEIAELRFALRAKDVEALLAELKAQGKIVPASEQYAREILLQGDGKVTFGDGEVTVAQLFERFLDAQPNVIRFGELAPGAQASTGLLSVEEEELLEKLGLTREQVEKYAGR